jgi:VWFA-related protein
VRLPPLYSVAEQAKDSQENPSAIVVNVNRVLIPVVVRDKQGQAVGDLKKEDFRVFDNDKPQTISGFTIEKRGGNESRTEGNTGSGQQPASIPSSPPEQSATASQRFIVFLFDDVHSSAEELANAKKAGGKMLAGTLGDSDVAAVVSLSEQINSGLISDRTRLQEAIMSLKKYTGSQAEVASDCPHIDYYQAYLMENMRDNAALQDAARQVVVCNRFDAQDSHSNPAALKAAAENLSHTAANRVLAIGAQDVHATYAAISEFVRRMANLPGQRTLILVSPGWGEQKIVAFAQIPGSVNVPVMMVDGGGFVPILF